MKQPKTIIVKSPHGEFEVICDAEDYEELSKFQLRVHRRSSRGFCLRAFKYYGNGLFRKISPVSILLRARTKQVRYKNGNNFDLRKKNIINGLDSIANHRAGKRKNTSSQYKGVHLDKRLKKWKANISKDNRPSYLGVFENEEKAAKAYDYAAEDLYGEDASKNFDDNKDVSENLIVLRPKYHLERKQFKFLKSVTIQEDQCWISNTNKNTGSIKTRVFKLFRNDYKPYRLKRTCDNENCVNPFHVEVVDENIRSERMKGNKRGVKSKASKDEIARMYFEECLTVTEVGERVGLTPGRISQILKPYRQMIKNQTENGLEEQMSNAC